MFPMTALTYVDLDMSLSSLVDISLMTLAFIHPLEMWGQLLIKENSGDTKADKAITSQNEFTTIT